MLAYNNYLQDCAKKKELNDTQIRTYKNEVGRLKSEQDQEMESIRTQGENDKQREE